MDETVQCGGIDQQTAIQPQDSTICTHLLVRNTTRHDM